MGTDIHLNAERFDGTQWITVPDPFTGCVVCRATGKATNPPDCDEEGRCVYCEGTGKRTREWYDGRNYLLFSVLAGVRGDGSIYSIKAARGLPVDICSDSKHAADDGYHDHSWLTLHEIVSWSGWDKQKITDTVWLTPSGYAALLNAKMEALPDGALKYFAPNPYEDKTWVDLSIPEMAGVVESGVLLPNHRTEVKTGIPLRAALRYFFTATVEPLCAEAARLGSDSLKHIRLVFSFDN